MIIEHVQIIRGTMEGPIVQLALPGFDGLPPPTRRVRVRRPPPCSRIERAGDVLLTMYLRRLAARGVAPKGFAAYRYQMRCLLAAAERYAVRSVTLIELFQDTRLLGQALIDDSSPPPR